MNYILELRPLLRLPPLHNNWVLVFGSLSSTKAVTRICPREAVASICILNWTVALKEVLRLFSQQVTAACLVMPL